jgi:hypothetical protein
VKIPERQAQIDALTRKYLTEPKTEEKGQRPPSPPPERSSPTFSTLVTQPPMTATTPAPIWRS